MRKKLSWLAATALALIVASIVIGLIASAVVAAFLVVCFLVASPVILLVMCCGFSIWWLLLCIPMVGFVIAMSHGTMRRSIFA